MAAINFLISCTVTFTMASALLLFRITVSVACIQTDLNDHSGVPYCQMADVYWLSCYIAVCWFHTLLLRLPMSLCSCSLFTYLYKFYGFLKAHFCSSSVRFKYL